MGFVPTAAGGSTPSTLGRPLGPSQTLGTPLRSSGASSGFSPSFVPTAATSPKGKKKKKKKNWLDFTVGIPGALLGDVAEAVKGLPQILRIAYNDIDKLTGDFLPMNEADQFMSDDVVKAVVDDYRYVYGPALRALTPFTDNNGEGVGDTLKRVAEHPLGPVLDVLAIFTGGATIGGKLAIKAVEKGGAKATVAGLSKPTIAGKTLPVGLIPARVSALDRAGLEAVARESISPAANVAGKSAAVEESLIDTVIKMRGGAKHKLEPTIAEDAGRVVSDTELTSLVKDGEVLHTPNVGKVVEKPADEFEYFLPKQKEYSWSSDGTKNTFKVDYSPNAVRRKLYQDWLGDKVFGSKALQRTPIVGTKARNVKQVRKNNIASSRFAATANAAINVLQEQPEWVRRGVGELSGAYDSKDVVSRLSVDTQSPLPLSRQTSQIAQDMVDKASMAFVDGPDNFNPMRAVGELTEAGDFALGATKDFIGEQITAAKMKAEELERRLETIQNNKPTPLPATVKRYQKDIRNHRRTESKLRDEESVIKGLANEIDAIRAGIISGKMDYSTAVERVSSLVNVKDRVQDFRDIKPGRGKTRRSVLEEKQRENALMREAGTEAVDDPRVRALIAQMELVNLRKDIPNKNIDTPDDKIVEWTAASKAKFDKAIEDARHKLSPEDFEEFFDWITDKKNATTVANAIRRVQDFDAKGRSLKEDDIEISPEVADKQRKRGLSETGHGLLSMKGDTDFMTIEDVIEFTQPDKLANVLRNAVARQVANYKLEQLTQYAMRIPSAEAFDLEKTGNYVIIGTKGKGAELNKHALSVIDSLDNGVRSIFPDDFDPLIDDMIARMEKIIKPKEGHEIVVPKAIHKTLLGTVKADNNIILKFLDGGPNRMWRAWMLGARPAWYGVQAVSNSILMMLSMSPLLMMKKLVAYSKDPSLQPIRDLIGYYKDGDVRSLIAEEAPDITSTGLHSAIMDYDDSPAADGKIFKRVATGLAYRYPEKGMKFAGKYIDDPFRTWRFQQIMRPHVKEMQKSLTRNGIPATNREALETLLENNDIMDLATKKTLDDMINFRDVSETERNNIRPFIPFYTWIAASSKYTARMAAEKPGLFNALTRASMAINKMDEKEFDKYGEMFPWVEERGIVGDKLLNLQQYSPFSAGGDVAGLLSSFLPGGTEKGQAWDPLTSLQPGIKAPIEASIGVDMFTGRPVSELMYDPEMGKGELAFRRYFRQFPWLRVLAENQRHDTATKDDIAKMIVPPRDLAQGLRHELSPLPLPRDWNPKAAVSQYEKIQVAKENAIKRVAERKAQREAMGG